MLLRRQVPSLSKPTSACLPCAPASWSTWPQVGVSAQGRLECRMRLRSSLVLVQAVFWGQCSSNSQCWFAWRAADFRRGPEVLLQFLSSRESVVVVEPGKGGFLRGSSLRLA